MEKKMDKELMEFVDKTPNAYYCINNLKTKLLEEGYEELYENEPWNHISENGKYFVTKNDSSLIAFKINEELDNSTGFNIVATHSDSPSFTIKSHPEIFDNNYLKLNTNGYGGMINYTWLDRPLSLAGRIILKNDKTYESHFINIDRDILVIPSQAIHINREVNKEATFNHQTDMLPIITINNNRNIKSIIRKQLEEQGIPIKQISDICDYDLYLYNRDKAKIIGYDNNMILSPRLDDLACVYPSFCAFTESDNKESLNVFCAFNNEEIGSLTEQGADSTFLYDTLKRIAKIKGQDVEIMLKNSFIVSADNAHAIHPAAASKSDPTNTVTLNGGVVIKHHKNYTTDGLTSSILKDICTNANVPPQDFECKSDMVCGSTLGGLSIRHVSIDSVDVGMPQLAMHSANETIGVDDIFYMYEAILEFYNTKIEKNKNKITLKQMNKR